MEVVQVTDPRPRQSTRSDYFWCVQVFLLLCIAAFNAHHVYTICKRYVPVSDRCGPEYPQYSVKLTDTTNISAIPPGALWLENGRTRVCPCRYKTCITKCCPLKETFVSPSDLTCSPTGFTEPWQLYVDAIYYKPQANETIQDLHPISLEDNKELEVIDHIRCDEHFKYILLAMLLEGMYIMDDGMILIGFASTYFDMDGFCVETFQQYNVSVLVTCEEKTVYDSLVGPPKRVYKYLSLGVQCVSILCLVFTLTVYLTIPQLHNHSGTLLASYLISLFMSCLIELLEEVNELLEGVIKEKLPFTLQYLVGFVSLAMPSWLAITCWDLWTVINQPLNAQSPKKFNWLWYLPFCFLGWGLPSLLCGLNKAVVDILMVAGVCPEPYIQQDPCFFSKVRIGQLFMLVPSNIVMEVNIVMFLSLWWDVRRGNRQNRVLPCEQSHATEIFQLYLKLQVMAGFEWALSKLVTYLMVDVTVFYFIIVTLKHCKGLIFFIVFICNKQVLGLLRQI